MKWSSRSSQQKLKMPTTQVYHLLDNLLTIVVRAWGSQEYNQKLIDEISYYMSSAQADLDVTSPFDFKENLSSLANRARVSILLAQDHFYKVENKTEFTVGFEVAVFFHRRNELAWASVGRFAFKKIESELRTLFEMGTDRDEEILLPVELLGVESDVEINAGSVRVSPGSQFILSSTYGGNLVFNKTTSEFRPNQPAMSYWYSVMSGD